MLSTHHLRNLFDAVIGTERDSRFRNKADAVRFMLKEFDLNPAVAAIVGDCMHDIVAGKHNGISLWG